MGRPARTRATAIRRWWHTAQALPRMGFCALRHGLLPAGLTTARTARREGVAELHWKVLGDGLVRFLRNSGPVLTKFGQVLANRTDLIHPTVCARLESLYTEQPPMKRRELQRMLRNAYGRKLPLLEFDKEPLAVGSIGQVHRARLAGGEAVIVKLIRPGVEERIGRDLDAVRALLDLLLAPWPSRRATRAFLLRCLDDLGRGYIQEVDLGREAAALREFEHRFAKNPSVRVPKCFHELSSKHIVVMEELVGESLAAYRRRASADPKAAGRVANLALTEILKQIFENGRFHADPHAGNLLILEDGRLGLIDLGLTGELGGDDRRRIARAVRAFLARDAEGLIRTLLGFGTLPPDFDHQRFEDEVSELVASQGKRLVARLRGQDKSPSAEDSNSLEDFVSELFALTYDYGICVPLSTTLLIKTLVTIEGVARSLNPDLNLATAAVPVVLRSLTPRWVRWVLGART